MEKWLVNYLRIWNFGNQKEESDLKMKMFNVIKTDEIFFGSLSRLTQERFCINYLDFLKFDYRTTLSILVLTFHNYKIQITFVCFRRTG